jgi:alkanesulfonate monooxygenase SsuD/methylene tetrahydromethanopterin reductase-like flavin-dependent oxidoreductase (luciferase family)
MINKRPRSHMKRGLYLAPFDELANPRLLIDLARAAESVGWDGLFLWDRIAYPPGGRAVSDPWVALSAVASVTDTLRLGPMITPLSRRRVQKVARETVTLDHLSNGRLTLGVGLGNADDLVPFGEVIDPRERGRLLDEGLERLGGFWSGAFRPLPRAAPADSRLGRGKLAQSEASPTGDPMGRPVPHGSPRTGRARRARRGGPASTCGER